MTKASFKAAAGLLVLAAVMVSGFFIPAADAAHEISGTALLYTYSDVRSTDGIGTSDNYFVVLNPSTNWVQAHVRVRTGDKSIELLDFDIMLSPKDVFNFLVSDNSATGTVFSSCDAHTIGNTKMLAPFLVDIDGDGVKDCVIGSTDPTDTVFYNPNMVSLQTRCLGITEAEAGTRTRKGYAEVIVEGAIKPCSTDKTKCASQCAGTSSDVKITEHTLHELTTYVDNAAGLCNNDILNVTNNPITPPFFAPFGIDGRIYYATVDPATMRATRLAHLNSEVIDGELPALSGGVDASSRLLILHKNNFEDEMQSTRCTSAAAIEHCMAYGDAQTTVPDAYSVSGIDITGGADDLNMCLYTDSKGTPAVGVWNKYGAGATFGPTLADTSIIMRDGSLPIIQVNLNGLVSHSAIEGTPFFGGLATVTAISATHTKSYMHTHFVNSPAPADFDLKTSIAVIFPFMHFIGEQPSLGSFTFYDMDENSVTAPSSGFISPGLPGPGSPANEEAFLQTITGTYPEGWVKIGAVTATNQTSSTACNQGGACPGGVDTRVCSSGFTGFACGAATGSSYTPGYTSAVFVHGADSVSSSLLNYFQF